MGKEMSEILLTLPFTVMIAYRCKSFYEREDAGRHV